MALVLIDDATGARIPSLTELDLDGEAVKMRYFYQGTASSPYGSVYVEHEDKHVSQHHARELGAKVADSSKVVTAKRVRRRRAG